MIDDLQTEAISVANSHQPDVLRRAGGLILRQHGTLSTTDDEEASEETWEPKDRFGKEDYDRWWHQKEANSPDATQSGYLAYCTQREICGYDE